MRSRIKRQLTSRDPWHLVPLLLLGLSISAHSAEQLTYPEAINEAGRQRMLTQRITKSHCMAGMIRDTVNSDTQLFEVQTDVAVSLFEVQLSDLKAFASNVAVNIALEDVTTLWETFKPLALSEPTRHSCKLLWELDDSLLSASERVVFLLQDEMGTPQARLVNISGRQRMLSQRIAKLYVLQAWRLAGAEEGASLEQARNEFEESLTILRDAPENTLPIRGKLEEVGEQWVWLRSALGLRDADFPIVVNDASERTLDLMENLTQLYTELPGRR